MENNKEILTTKSFFINKYINLNKVKNVYGIQFFINFKPFTFDIDRYEINMKKYFLLYQLNLLASRCFFKNNNRHMKKIDSS